MITLKLIIYSLILFILFVKIPSCKNNIIDLLNIILIIILFNLVLEKMINTNMQENYESITSSNYSFIDNEDKSNSYDYQTINLESDKSKNDNNNLKNDSKKENDLEKENDSKKENDLEIKNDSKKEINEIKNLKQKTNDIVNVIKDNVKNIIDNTNLNKNTNIKDTPEINNKFIYGYSYLHTDNWSIPEKRQPVCKNVNPCKICSNKTTGFKSDLMKY
jgi:hypothetical protein